MKKRIISISEHNLEFEIPAVILGAVEYQYPYQTHEIIDDMLVGYIVNCKEADTLEGINSFVTKYFSRENISSLVLDDIAKFCTKLEIDKKSISVIFRQEGSFLSGLGQAIQDKNHKAVLLIDFVIMQEHETFGILGSHECKNIIPHELMHIQDTFCGRSPSCHPIVLPEHGGWVDLFRHLWIDGHLEQLGLPSTRKEFRTAELRAGMKEYTGEVDETHINEIVDAWWGKPMTLKEAIELGLQCKFPLEKNCPMAEYFNR